MRRISYAACTPSISGIPISRSTISGSSFRTFSMPCLPFSASPQTTATFVPISFRTARAVLRAAGWSSTSRTRAGIFKRSSLSGRLTGGYPKGGVLGRCFRPRLTIKRGAFYAIRDIPENHYRFYLRAWLKPASTDLSDVVTITCRQQVCSGFLRSTVS